MAGESPFTIAGNIANEPELGFTSSGAGYLNLTIASTPRILDKNTNEWKDGEALFIRGTAWRNLAENSAETLKKGMGVIAVGSLKQRSFEKDGEKRTVIEMDITDIAPSLRYATAQVAKTTSGGGGIRNAAGGSDVWSNNPGANTGMQAPF
ncbi:single-stranded DNA-binding protein [Nocardia sp. NPDC051570]|uniref:single-stranded DNA-binding protein n=1 Tax=Nocardia sp. NPDC051570 TaxID=3364324 RepID=UPI00378A0878